MNSTKLPMANLGLLSDKQTSYFAYSSKQFVRWRLMVAICFFLFLNILRIEAQTEPELRNFKIDKCSARVSFEFKMGNDRCVDGGVCEGDDYNREVTSADIYLIVGGNDEGRVMTIRGDVPSSGGFSSFTAGTCEGTKVQYVRRDRSYVSTGSKISETYRSENCAGLVGKRVNWHNYYMPVYIDLPNGFDGKEISVQVRNLVYNGSSHGNINSSKVNSERVPTASGLISERDCNEATIKWSAVSFSCSDSKLKYRVYRDGTQISGDLASNVTSFKHNIAYDGRDHDYAVEVKFEANRNQYSMSNLIETGPSPEFDSPDDVFDLQLTNPKCEDLININWQVTSDVKATSFTVERSTTPTFDEIAPFTGTASPASAQSYSDDQFQYDVEYFYRIVMVDDCNNTVTGSEVKSIIVDGPPDESLITNVQPQGDKTVLIEWEHNGLRSTGYDVWRVEIESGRREKIARDLPLSDRSYFDVSANNCFEYSYEVQPLSECFDPVESGSVKQVVSFNDELNAFSNLEASKFYYNDRVLFTWTLEAENASEVVVYRHKEGSGDSPREIARMPLPAESFNDEDVEPGVLYRYGVMAISCSGYVPTEQEKATMKSDVGGRSEYGIINGKIVYEGGNAVEGAKVIASPSSGENRGVSLYMDQNGLSVPLENNGTNWFPSSQWSISFWMQQNEAQSSDEIFKVSDGTDSIYMASVIGDVQTFNEIEYEEVSVVEGLQDELVGYKDANGVVTSLTDGSILGVQNGDRFNEFNKEEISGLKADDTLYHFISGRPWLFNDGDEWFELTKTTDFLPEPDSLFGYLSGDTIYESFDNEFVLAFIQNDRLRMANHFNVSYELSTQYGHIANNEFIFNSDTLQNGKIIDDIIYTSDDRPIHMIRGNNIFYLYTDELSGKLVRGKRFARKIPNETDPNISFDVFLLEKTISESISAGETLGIVATDRSKVFDQNNSGIVNFLIDDLGVVRTVNYVNKEVYLPAADAIYESNFGILSDLDGNVRYVFNDAQDTLYRISNKIAELDADGFAKDLESGEFVYFFGEFVDGEQQIYKAIDNEIVSIQENITGSYNKTAYQLKLSIGEGDAETIVTDDLYIGEYNNVLFSYNGNDLILFINGKPTDTIQSPGLNSLFQQSVQSMDFGSYKGYLDEVLVWDEAKSKEKIEQDFNRYLLGNEDHLVGYWRLDESVGSGAYNAAYDDLNTGDKDFSTNHGLVTNAELWSNIVPEQEQLSFTAFTDAEGNYSIQSIIYTGAGNNFKIVPILGSHRFEPANEILFLGKSQQIHNQIDFTDVSSFTVTGTVKYAPTILGFADNDDLNAPNCYVENVDILVDGKVVLQDGEQVKTDKNGRFEIQVPIGRHNISVNRQNHVFVSDVWPPEGDFDFQQDQFDLVFLDSTRRKIIGKVVGGITEGEKVSGTGLPKNNIGIATIKLKSIGKTCFETIVETDSLTGEFYAELPPFRYNIVDINIKSQSTNFNRSLRKLATASINLDRDTLSLKTVQCLNSDLCTVSERDYHFRRDFIFMNAPEIQVKSTDENYPDILGNQEWVNEEGDPIDLKSKPLPYEVFTTGSIYNWDITLLEKYLNYDATFSDPALEVEVYRDTIRSGEILIKNDIAAETINLDLSPGTVRYIFAAGESSILMDRQDPENSFTKSVQISGPSVNWEPDGEVFRGYIFGTVQDKTQQSFYTVAGAGQEYQVIDFILRDPPGSQSYTRLEEKSKITKVRSSSVKRGIEQRSSLKLGVMIEVAASSGVAVVKSQVFKNTIGISTRTDQYRSAQQTSMLTFETQKSIQTSSENKNTGAGSDIFVGNAFNIFFSPSHNINLIPTGSCGVDGAECYPLSFTIDGESYSLARERSISFGVQERPTLFQYTQRQIEQLIAEMENDLSAVEDAQDSEGINRRSQLTNQIRIWKSAIAQNEFEKLMAKQALDGNSPDVSSENLSFAYGSNVRRDFDLGITNEFNNAQDFNWYVGGALNLEMLVGPVYGKFDLDLGYANYISTSDKTNVTDSKALTIQMSDNDPGDRYSVDLITASPQFQNLDDRQELEDLYTEYSTKGDDGLFPTSGQIADVDNTFEYNVDTLKFFNPIFITRGGRTSCPYEPQEHARYLEYLPKDNLDHLVTQDFIESFTYDEDTKTADITYLPPTNGLSVNEKLVLNYGTFKRDQPGLQIEPRVKRNVPWDQRAQFDIILENKNVEDTIRTYTLMVDQRTTGVGPTMRLDGERFIKGTPIPLFGGEALRKTFTMRPIRDVYDYENIVIYLVAGCQFDFGQDLDFQEDIFDRDTISAFFDPVCPRATEVYPTQGWSVNNQTGSQLSLEIQEQAFFFENHSKIILQYKAAYQSDEDWVDIAIWSKDPAEVETLINSGENAFNFDTENNYIIYEWETADYPTPDGEYMVRWKYFCENGLESQSAPIAGRIDRTSPHAFGRPQPADGILSSNDEIILTLNEPIEEGLVDRDLITVRGKINGTQLLHPVSVRFAGNEHIEIPNIHWNQDAITVEMWVRTDEDHISDQVLFHHSEAGKSAITFTLQQDGRLKLQLNNSELVTDDPISLDEWSHIAFSFDPLAKKAAIYQNATLEAFDELFIGTHIASGSIIAGEGFHGNIHELRLWKRYMTATDIAPNFYKDLTGREIGLVGYWSLTEGKGILSQDKVSGRNAILSANWWLEPASISYEFTGNNPITIPSMAFEASEDFTIEFWIKPAQASLKQTIVSNGGPVGLDWDIHLNSANQLELSHNGNQHVLIDSALTANEWHHIAIVVNRIGNTTSYLNGKVNTSLPGTLFSGFGGPGVFLGANFTSDLIGNLMSSDHFTGLMDEFRIWRMAKRAEQIQRTSWYKLNGDEFGLVSYLPFEKYNDFLRITEGSLVIYNEDGDAIFAISEAESYSNENPEIILKPTETPVNFDFSVSGNQILISLDEDNPAVVENCILDISVRNLIDRNGNVMESPVTWSVFVDRNQVVWDQRAINLEKELGEALSFNASVVNQGGENTSFQIKGLPLWLTANPSGGLIGPDSRQEISFIINPGLNIGDYQEPVHLVTDFGFNEALLINMKVRSDLPKEWSFNPSDYQYTMNLIGQAKVDNIFSTDPEDIVSAFVNDTLRGFASLEYQEVYDNYQVFLSVYSNELSGEQIEFRIWDASEGKVLNNIKVDGETMSFVENAIFGSPANPVIFEAKNSVLRQIDIPKGWKWISFNLNSEELARTRNLFKNQQNEDGDRILSADEVDVYDAVNDLWLGKIAGDNLPPGVGGYDLHQSYRIYADQETQLTVSGDPLQLSTQAINLYSPNSAVNGREWNWISFLGQDNMEVNEALASLQPQAGDVIKGQYAFAIYDPVLKWVGNLEFLQPGEGYLIKISTDQQLIYPASGLITGTRSENHSLQKLAADLNPHKYEENMPMVIQVVGLPLEAKDAVLKSYAKDEIRGVAKSFTDEQNRMLFFMTNFGDQNTEKLHFAIEHNGETSEFDELIPFSSEKVSGSFENPVVLNLGEAESGELFGYSYPNPFSDEVNISFAIGQQGRATVKVFAMDGKLILDRDFTGNANESMKFLWDGKSESGNVISSGNYVLQIENGDVSHQELLVKE